MSEGWALFEGWAHIRGGLLFDNQVSRVGAYSRGRLFNNFRSMLGAYSRGGALNRSFTVKTIFSAFLPLIRKCLFPVS